MSARPLNILIAPGMLPAHVIPYLEPARLLCAGGHRVYFYAERYASAMVKPTGCRFIESAAPDATERFLRQRALPGQTRAAQAFTDAANMLHPHDRDRRAWQPQEHRSIVSIATSRRTRKALP